MLRQVDELVLQKGLGCLNLKRYSLLDLCVNGKPNGAFLWHDRIFRILL